MGTEPIPRAIQLRWIREIEEVFRCGSGIVQKIPLAEITKVVSGNDGREGNMHE